MNEHKATGMVGRVGLPPDILKSWWSRRYLTGRAATLTYDFVGLALSVIGDYVYVCLRKPIEYDKSSYNENAKREGTTVKTEFVAHWGVCNVSINQSQIAIAGVRIWNCPEEANSGGETIPGLFFSDFSHFNSKTEGWGEFHWTFYHYPWNAWRNQAADDSTILNAIPSKSLENLQHVIGESAAPLQSLDFRLRDTPKDSDLADPLVPVTNPTRMKQITSARQAAVKYLHCHDCALDLTVLRNDRARRNLWDLENKHPPFYRGYVFSETDREAAQSRVPEWCLSGQYVRIPTCPDDLQNPAFPTPFYSNVYFFRTQE